MFVGDISYELKTEADSSDITDYQHDDMPSTGMIVFRYKCILCTTFDVLPVNHHVTSLVCMSVVKISVKFIRPTTVFCGTDLLYQTQYEIQITAGSGSVNESLIDTVGCLCSIAVCLCFPLFHNVHICICSV